MPDERCRHCKVGHMTKTDQNSYLVCNECGAMRFLYQPQDYQAKFHADPAKYRAFFGGYG